jgi:hypothetical protein
MSALPQAPSPLSPHSPLSLSLNTPHNTPVFDAQPLVDSQEFSALLCPAQWLTPPPDEHLAHTLPTFGSPQSSSLLLCPVQWPAPPTDEHPTLPPDEHLAPPPVECPTSSPIEYLVPPAGGLAPPPIEPPAPFDVRRPSL